MQDYKKKTIRIAVTGNAGSGKTSVCEIFKKLGEMVIFSDAIAREVVAPGSYAYKNIINLFGQRVLKENGSLNRQLLRKIIINDDSARKTLEKIVHPEIIRLIKLNMNKAEKDVKRFVVVEIPLLFELDMKELFDLVITVSADHELRLNRLICRDKVSCEDAKLLFSIQMPEEEKAKRAEFVIKNDGSIEQLEKSVELLYKKLIKKY
ncbi:MAG: dephospho-CoA kinase [Proteobacteria bacterium]|nr:dephospho-CoA kinase [Desulfobacteraceae bacterium]MBU2520950.1 dephospho-CoA kinase [Pseudomonadota bacterium]MBU3980694.1 dephospho-CoA kinase [Pseudomonadota bacterium]MBU4012477.1 dephospho-CoA kinase [Pseudomonadota bacterium]MBU4069005.1 dephospho-CoA kinase [Pseudomonadota bacterium]